MTEIEAPRSYLLLLGLFETVEIMHDYPRVKSKIIMNLKNRRNVSVIHEILHADLERNLRLRNLRFKYQTILGFD